MITGELRKLFEALSDINYILPISASVLANAYHQIMRYYL